MCPFKTIEEIIEEIENNPIEYEENCVRDHSFEDYLCARRNLFVYNKDFTKIVIKQWQLQDILKTTRKPRIKKKLKKRLKELDGIEYDFLSKFI